MPPVFGLWYSSWLAPCLTNITPFFFRHRTNSLTVIARTPSSENIILRSYYVVKGLLENPLPPPRLVAPPHEVVKRHPEVVCEGDEIKCWYVDFPTYSTSHSAVVDAYSTSLTRTTPAALSVARYQLSAASVGNYALFAGGYTGSNSDAVDTYNASLTRTTPTVLSAARAYLAATSVGNYALFGGGPVNGMVMMQFDQTVEFYKNAGAEIADGMTDQEILDAIEYFKTHPPEAPPSPEERMAAAMEYQSAMLGE